MVRPGELNLMTAGSGIAHSEFSTTETTVLHGAQLWVALPDADRDVAPGFEHYAPPVVEVDGVRVLVFLGALLGQSSPVTMHSRLVGAEIGLEPGHDADRAGRPHVRARHPRRLRHSDRRCRWQPPPRTGLEAKRGELAYLPTGLHAHRDRGRP